MTPTPKTWSLAAAAGALGLAALLTAGPLTPPTGSVVSTYRTLGEVGPHTPVQSLPGTAAATHVISQPGAYYLTRSIQGTPGKVGALITAPPSRSTSAVSASPARATSPGAPPMAVPAPALASASTPPATPTASTPTPVSQNDIGIKVDGIGNFSVRNTASFKPTRFVIPANNSSAQWIVSPAVGFVSTDPWANFGH